MADMRKVVGVDTFKSRLPNMWNASGGFISDILSCANFILSDYSKGGWLKTNNAEERTFKILIHGTWVFNHNVCKLLYLHGTEVYHGRIFEGEMGGAMACFYNNMEILRCLGLDIDIAAYSRLACMLPYSPLFSRENKIRALHTLHYCKWEMS